MTHAPVFRGLGDAFLDALDALITDDTGQWWRDVLAHPDLILAVRLESLNVYHRGASLFRVKFRNGRPTPETHVKYLVRQRQNLADLSAAGTFGFQAKDVLWHEYAGPETLAEMIRAAGALSGPEKTLLHPLIQSSPNVIDVEVSLTGESLGGSVEDESPGAEAVDGLVPDDAPAKAKSARMDRIDVASLETRGDPKRAWLVFHEAKHFANPALRSAPKKRPEVLNQLGRYQSSIGQNSGALSYSYPYLCQALVRLDAMRRKVRTGHPAWASRSQPDLAPLVAEIANGQRHLMIETKPRLVVFGFDADQRDGALVTIRDRLEQEFGVTVYAVGNPKGNTATPAFQPSKAVLDAHAKILDDEANRPPAPEPAAIISAPAYVPTGLSQFVDKPKAGSNSIFLFFDKPNDGVYPIYLVNAGETALTDVVVTVGSPIGDPLSPRSARKLNMADASLPPQTGALIGRYSIYYDGETLFAVTADFTGADGERMRGETLIDKGASPSHVALKVQPLSGIPATVGSSSPG